MSMRALVLVFAIVLGAEPAPSTDSLSGRVNAVTVAPGDTLHALGSRFGVEPATIARDNGRALAAPLRIGETLKIDNRHIIPSFTADVTLLVNVPQKVLFVALPAGVAAYPVAVGRRSWPTPLGEFAIVSKEANPTWNVPESIREEARRAGRSLPLTVPPGPNNPLGAYWLGLSMGGVGIHGTNAPTSIYRTLTHGCIRLHPDDIATVFREIQVGTRGLLVYQPVLIGVAGGDIFVEAHPDVYGRAPRDAYEFVEQEARKLGVFERVDWDAVARVIHERVGTAQPVSR